MDEIISGVQVIKMYAWEIPFGKLITYARELELKALRNTCYVRALPLTTMLFTTRMALFCTILTIALLYGPEEITAAKIFVVSSYFGILSHMMSQRFSRSVAEISEVLVALRRLQKFLFLEEKKSESEKNGASIAIVNGRLSTENDVFKNSNASISMRNVTARWIMPNSEDSVYAPKKYSIQNGINSPNETISNGILKRRETTPELHLTIKPLATLNNINIDFPKGKLIGVIGPVGAGKSSLLQVILRELPLESGSLSINGSISYASQESWVFAASVRQNILFGEEYDRERYNSVVQTCALERDFDQFENGDRTIVGERGASLSGGQKARIK